MCLLPVAYVISLLTFAKGPRSPRPHTPCVSHLGLGKHGVTLVCLGWGPRLHFQPPWVLLVLRAGRSSEGPLQRWALPPPQAGKRKNGLPTDLRPLTPALGACQVCYQMPRGDLGPAQKVQWAPWEQGGLFWALGMRGYRGGSLVPSPMIPRGPWATGQWATWIGSSPSL